MGRDKDKFNTSDDYDFENDFGGITYTDNDISTEPLNIPEESFEEESYNRGGKKKKKKKRRKKRYLLKFFLFLLVLAGIFVFSRSDFFNIETITVNNNIHYTEEQIIEAADLKVGDNLFEFTVRNLEKKLTADPYIETVEIKRVLPNALNITVKERKEQLVVQYSKKFIVADYEGMVLRLTDEPPDLPIVDNLKPLKVKPGTALEVKETETLTETLNLLKDVDKVELYFKKLTVAQHTVKAYIYDNLIVEGSYENISENLSNISRVMEDLNKQKVKRGTIKVSGNDYCVFQPEVDTKDA